MMLTVSAPASSAVNESLAGCCRRLAARAAEIAALPAGSRLHRDLVAVAAEYERLLADPAVGPAIRTGEQAWPDVAGTLLDPLLTAAGTALRGEPDLTALIADTVLRARPGSRAAWRLRA